MPTSLMTILQRGQLANLQTAGHLVTLVRQLEIVSLSAGERLFSAGDDGDAAYLITLGTLEIRAQDGSLLATEHSGALVGEQALMPGGGGKRNATIVAQSDCRLLVVDRDAFAKLLSEREAALEEVSVARTKARLTQTAGPLKALLEHSEERSWEDGSFVFRQGDAADGIYLILGGQAEVVLAQDGEPVHVATLYTGQCFGEAGVLQGAPRNAGIVARHHLKAAFVPAERVRALNNADGSTEAYLESLIRSRELPQLGRVSQHAVVQDGELCTQTTFYLNDGRELVAMRTPRGHYTVMETGSTVAETVNIAAATTVSLDKSGRIVGFDDHGAYEDVGGLQTLALDGSPLTLQQRRLLKKAAKAAANLAPDKVLCRCLNVDRQTILTEIGRGSNTLALLQEATGCGTGCGGCLRRINPILEGEEADTPEIRLGGPQKGKAGFVGWLRKAMDS